MKKQFTFFMLLMTTIRLLPSLSANASYNHPTLSGLFSVDWEKLAETKINQGLNRHEMMISADNKPFSAVKIRSVQGGVNLHRCIFHYKNGETLTVEMRNDLPAGTDSRVIQLPRKKDPVIKVEFWYDTKNYGDQKASLELWGKS